MSCNDGIDCWNGDMRIPFTDDDDDDDDVAWGMLMGGRMLRLGFTSCWSVLEEQQLPLPPLPPIVFLRSADTGGSVCGGVGTDADRCFVTPFVEEQHDDVPFVPLGAEDGADGVPFVPLRAEGGADVVPSSMPICPGFPATFTGTCPFVGFDGGGSSGANCVKL
jgi:hypothetical protein